MNIKIVVCIIALGAIAGLQGCGGGDKHPSHDTEETQADVYTCPMHPSVVQNGPGACPVCNMALVKKSAQAPMTAEEEAMLRTVSLSPAQRVMANVATVPAQYRTMSGRLEAPGVIDFAEPLQRTVAARFRGRIEELYVASTGTRVRAGDPLFRIYSPDLVAAQQDYLTARRAGNGEAGSSQLVQSALRRLRVHYGLTEAQVEGLVKAGDAPGSIPYLSPASGTVIRKQVTEGQYVEEGAGLYELADLSRVWVSVEIPEKDIRFVRTGTPARLGADAWPGESFVGRVTFIEPVLNAETRTVRVRVEVSNPHERLKPGMYVRAALAARGREALAVPANAVVETGTRSVVWVEVRTNQFEPRNVTTGERADGWVEILGGLEEGEMAVATGGYLLDSESALQNPLGTSTGTPQPVPQTQRETPVSTDAPRDTPRGVSQEPKPAGEKQEAGAASRGPQVRKVRVDGEYFPSSITVKKDQPVRILFDRREDAKCSDEVVIADFGIRKKLAPFSTTSVEFTPTKSGTFRIVCGMDMMEMKLVVTP